MKGHFDAPDAPEKRMLVTLLAADNDLNLYVLGSAFIVGASGTKALCLCAAHSLEQVKAFENERRPRSAWQLPPDMVPTTPDYFSPERIHAVLLIGGEVITCAVEQLNYFGGNDIALIVIVAPDGRDLFHEKLSIDLAMPRPGDEVAILANDISLKRLFSGKGQISMGLEVRQGVVTEVVLGKGEMSGQSYIAHTTIPVPGGMSGAPVIKIAEEGQPVTVIGVVSADLSPEEAALSHMVPGRSTISLLWPALGLGIQTPDYMSLDELRQAKYLDDRTASTTTVIVDQNQAETTIDYLDAEHRLRLQAIGHPHARAAK